MTIPLPGSRHPLPFNRNRAAFSQAAPLLGLLLLAGCSSGSGDDDDDDATLEETPTPAPSPSPTPEPTATPEPTPVDWPAHASALMDFWTAHNLDETHGGYYSFVRREGTVFDTDKWTRVLSREVYGYVKSFQLTGDLDDLSRAKLGVDFLLTYAWDQEHGGFRQELTAEGTLETDKRDLFNLVYALTGLTAYLEVTQDPTVKQVVTDTYTLLDQVAWDTTHGGYYKELNLDMGGVKNDDKTFNALVDTATAYLFNLYAATGDTAYRDRLYAIGLNITDHLIDPDGAGFIGENFNRDWSYDPAGSQFGDRTICGHNLKTIWTLLRIHFLTETLLFQTEAEDLIEVALDACRDRDYGGIFDQVDRQTGTVSNDGNLENVDSDDTNKAWWQQEQGMFASRLMAVATDKSFYDRVSNETRNFYLKYFLDREYGEVFGGVSREGVPTDTTKGNEWKSAYHSVETAYFSHLYDAFFVYHQPVTLYYHFEATDTDRVVRLTPFEAPYGTFEVDDPVTLDGEALPLDTPSQVVIEAGQSGLLEVVYRPVTD